MYGIYLNPHRVTTSERRLTRPYHPVNILYVMYANRFGTYECIYPDLCNKHIC